MSKFKCAYLYAAADDMLPARKEFEKAFGVKVVYGLGKSRKTTPLVERMSLVEDAFASVRDLLLASQPPVACLSQLVVFDENIDSVWFSMTFTHHILTKFAVDAQIIDQMHDLSSTIGYLRTQLRSLQNDMVNLLFFQNKIVDDQQFLNGVTAHQAHTQAYSSEVQRVLESHKVELAAQFRSGW